MEVTDDTVIADPAFQSRQVLLRLATDYLEANREIRRLAGQDPDRCRGVMAAPEHELAERTDPLAAAERKRRNLGEAIRQAEAASNVWRVGGGA